MPDMIDVETPPTSRAGRVAGLILTAFLCLAPATPAAAGADSPGPSGAAIPERGRSGPGEQPAREGDDEQERLARPVEFGARLLEKAGQKRVKGEAGWEIDRQLGKVPGDDRAAELTGQPEPGSAGLEELVEECRARAEVLDAALDDRRREFAALEAELEAARKAAEEEKGRAEEQESLAETLDDILVERDREIAGYQMSLEEFRSREAETAGAFQEREGALENAGEQIAELKGLVEEYRSRTAFLNESLDEKEREIDGFQGLGENLSAQQSRIADLEQEEERLRKLNSRFARKLKESTLRLLELERKLPGGNDEKGRLRSQAGPLP